MSDSIRITPVNGHITALTTEGMCISYVVCGKDRAAVIDTFTAEERFGDAVRSITSLPLVVLNTHGHGDHTAGNNYFDKARLNAQDHWMFEELLDDPEMRQDMEDQGLAPCQVTALADGDLFDLGGITLEAIHTPGHTPGSICLLDREDRILFTGDAVLDMIWMQLPESLPIPKLVESLERLSARRSEFDQLLTGHWQWRSEGLTDASLLDELLTGARELAAGKTDGDVPYEWFDGVSRAHFYAEERRIIYP